MAYVVELRRPPPVVYVDVHAGRKHSRRTPSPVRTVKRKRAFNDGRRLAREAEHRYVTSASTETTSPSTSWLTEAAKGYHAALSTPLTSPGLPPEACLDFRPTAEATPPPRAPP